MSAHDGFPTAGAGPAAERHTAVVFSTDAEWAEHLVAFVRTGLERAEQVQYFADTTDPGQVMRTLGEHGIDAASAARHGRLVVTTASRTYLAGPRFDPDAVVGLWFEAHAAALAQGHSGLRAIGEMSWGARETAGAERLLEYELRMHHEVFDRIPLTAWCFYDRRLFPAESLKAVLGAHLTRLGPDEGADAGPALTVAPLADRPGFRLSGSAGYESRAVTASAAAAVAGSTSPAITLDLSALDHLEVAALAEIAHAAMRRPGPEPVRLLGAPASLIRMLDVFPELATGLEVAGR
ncbi:MEDS domain-containing protein [Streptomyces sp. LP11]|uniref:MEDS domain-containing protein n=1 Tax=Streptomyces pyxinicus TaxID=2970331 RepID=A0ABT2B733_9ACTN|nr:MEDS domain-containing protein [Streptomyces sp. LP11]MCS0604332.1 MEDS domain-containing protein [Streptomyces sp. LP11]